MITFTFISPPIPTSFYFLFFFFHFIFTFFGVAGIGRNFFGEVYVNLVVIQDQFSSSISLHCLSMKLAGAEVTSTEILEFMRIQVNLLQITTTMLPLPIKKHPFQLLPSCGNNIQFTYWNCLLLILNISKKLFSFITRNFGFNWELRFSFKYRYHSFAENLKKSHN